MTYLIETQNLNDPDAPVDMDICTVPGRTNQSGEERTDGWLGTTNNVYMAAHGEFETQEQAEAAAAAMGYTCTRNEWITDADLEFGVVARYRTIDDARETWEAGDWLDRSACAALGISVTTTDADLQAIAATLENEANTATESDRPYGVTINGLARFLRKLREDA